MLMAEPRQRAETDAWSTMVEGEPSAQLAGGDQIEVCRGT